MIIDSFWVHCLLAKLHCLVKSISYKPGIQRGHKLKREKDRLLRFI